MTQPQQPQQRNLFDLFDDDAKRTVQLARDEVIRTKRDAIGPEHLLLGLLSIETGKGRAIAVEAGVDIDAWREAIDAVAGMGSTEEPPQQLPFTPRGQQTMQLLVQIISSLFHRTIGTEHLLMALLQDPEGVASKALERISGSREQLGAALSEHLKSLPVDEQLKAQAEAMRAQQAQAQAQAQGQGQPAPRMGGGRALSPSAQRILQAADAQAAELKHAQVGTVHLLLALAGDADRMANNVFVKLGVRPEDVRAELLRQLRAGEEAGGDDAAVSEQPAPAEA